MIGNILAFTNRQFKHQKLRDLCIECTCVGVDLEKKIYKNIEIFATGKGTSLSQVFPFHTRPS